MSLLESPVTREAEMFSLENVSWELYELLLRDVDHQNVRITYDQGRMVLMSPLPRHDKVKTLLGRFIEMASLERDVPISSFGSTTWKRQDVGKGLEADECYYVTHEPQVRGKSDIDLTRDPVPDLAVEVEITRHPMDRPSIYAALGVAELWRFDGRRVQFLRLREGERYEPVAHSVELPFLTPEVINRFLGMFGETDENGVMRAFRTWLSGGSA